MRRIRHFILAAAITVAAAAPAVPAHALMCSRELQQVCATVFAPICAVKPTACPR